MGYPVYSYQLSCNSLPNFRLMVRGAQNRKTGMGVEVNESGRDYVTLCIYLPARFQERNIPPVYGNTVTCYSNRGCVGRITTAVQYRTAINEYV